MKGHLSRCDQRTRDSFAKLETYLHGGAANGELHRLIGKLRNQLTFHYGEGGNKLWKRAMEFKSGRGVEGVSTVQRGTDARRWHFQVTEDLVDSIVVRQFWGVPPNLSERDAADNAADEMHAIFLSFMDFAGEFIWTYCESL